jgi:hypothetical protein
MRNFHETTPAVCRVGLLAAEAAGLIAERRGLEDADPVRWAAIDERLDALAIEAGAGRAVSREGLFLQACVGAAHAEEPEAKACLDHLARALVLKPLTGLLAYYVGSETDGSPDDRPLPQDR